MPQEIVIPVVKVRELEGKTAERSKTGQVRVQVLGGPHKITTNRHRFQLIQTDAVSEKAKPITLRIGLYHADEAISTVETVTFDSASNDISERTKSVGFALKGNRYDKTAPYHLILRNAETGVEEARIDVTIDLAFTDEF